ncbi:MAG: porin family protein [Muribaculaceae bacterium]|nr:porin family protein [Muribaculaceae bacterium]
MKKLLLLTVMALSCALSMNAAAGDMAVGMQFSYASKNSMMGLGVNYQIEVVRNLRVQPEFIYYFENKKISDYNVNLNLQYLIPTSNYVRIYPMAGFSYVNFTQKGILNDSHTDKFGANIGLGFEYAINQNFRFYTEQRFHILKNWNEGVTALGLRYAF